MFLRNNRGQATIEYVLILSLLILVVANMGRLIEKAVKSTAGSLTYTISEHLTIGVCDKNCVIKAYKNY